MPTPESHTQDQEMTVIHRRVPETEPRGGPHRPRRIRLHEAPTSAWIMASAFTPEFLPTWLRYILAFITWPATGFLALGLGLKNVYRTDDFSGVVIMHRKDPGNEMLDLTKCFAVLLIPIVLGFVLLIPGIPPQVLNWAVPAVSHGAEIALVWLILGLILVSISGPLTQAHERRKRARAGDPALPKLAPRGTPKLDRDGPTFAISGAAKRIDGNGGLGATFRLTRSLIKDLPEGTFVAVQPRTGTLRSAYERQGFVASGRKEMVFETGPGPERQ